METVKELDATSGGNNISVLIDWKSIPKAYFSSSRIFCFLIFIEKHFYGNTEVHSAFMEYKAEFHLVPTQSVGWIWGDFLIDNMERMDR